jgi:hypothetical protein
MKCLDSMQRSIYAHLSEFPTDAQCILLCFYGSSHGTQASRSEATVRSRDSSRITSTTSI